VSIRNIWKKSIEFIEKILFPDSCVICGAVPEQFLTGNEEFTGICPSCEKKLVRVKAPFCMRCGKPLGPGSRQEYCEDCKRGAHAFTQGRAVFVYQGPIIGSMHRLKYSDRRDYAPVFAREAWRGLHGWIERIRVDAIVPIPLHKKRQRIRGYNQAELLARELSEISGVPLVTDLLVRKGNTKPQKMLNSSERKNNLKNAFQIDKKRVQLGKVLIIDDIYTTGSTVDAAAAALRSAGITKVYVLCICIGGGNEGGLNNDGSENL
jgi:ComF family protein